MSKLKSLLLVLFLSGCATVQVQREVFQGEAPLFQPARTLGVIEVCPETRWRPDQKEPKLREGIARAAIEAVFRSIPTGRVNAIRPFAPSSSREERFETERAAGIDTMVFITVEELGPKLYLSIPALWSTYSDIQFQLWAVRTTGETVLDVKHHRTVGGPFQLRGLGPLQGEMETALRDVLGSIR